MYTSGDGRMETNKKLGILMSLLVVFFAFLCQGIYYSYVKHMNVKQILVFIGI